MPLQILSSPSSSEDVAREIEQAIRAAFPDAAIEVQAQGGGHFEVRVVDASFEGQGRVVQQQRVYATIAPLMAGDDAPVHAIDRLVTATP